MKKLLIYLSRTSVILTLLLTMLYSAASAASLEGRWEAGLRLGPSFLVEHLSDKTEGKVGLLVNGNISYGLTGRVILGINIEWEKHEIKDRSSDFLYGNQSTISMLPTIEFHPRGGSPFSPYLFLGVGMNWNSFSRSSDLEALCSTCDITPGNTLALKGGGGIDYFISPNLVYNIELGLKMNDGTSDINGNFMGFASGTSTDNRACVLSLILGVRYF